MLDVEVRTARLSLHAIDEVEARRLRDRAPRSGDSWAADYPFAGDLAAVGGFLHATEHSGEQRPFGYYQIRRQSDGLAIGGVGFKGTPEGGVVEIGYGLAPSARGHGYATEAVGALVRIAAGLGVTAIRADTARDNVASQRTLENAGFEQVGADSDLLRYETDVRDWQTSSRSRAGYSPPVPSFEITPIGTVRNDRTDVQHTDNWGAVRSTIAVDERFGEACLQGLEGFSHVEVLFIFDRFAEAGDYREARPYRGRPDLPPVGIFAGRGPRRPNRIGVTCCAIEAVHGRELTVVGLDAVSGTPVIDLKPTMAEFLPVDTSQPAWVSGLMSEYFKP